MTDSRTIDLLEIGDFLDPATRAALVAELRATAGAAATVTGGEQPGRAVAPQVRRATRLAVADDTRARIHDRLRAGKGALEARFGVALADCEPPQFLRYETGDFFVAHQDGNTPLVFDDTRFRRVSVVLFLSEPAADADGGDYGGGALVFHGPPSDPMRRHPVTPPAGTLVAFRSETTHEVALVTHGERLTVVAWFR